MEPASINIIKTVQTTKNAKTNGLMFFDNQLFQKHKDVFLI